jgi:CheY-like chemotaxis protein
LADEQPLHPASASALAADHNVPAPPEPGAGALRHKLILVIDDESDARVLLEHLIEGYGCRVIAASSGEQGLRMAREFRPDLITVDLIMPRMDGWQLIKELKADAQLRNIPILVVSIVANEQAGKILGAVDVVEKPLIRENLLAAMSRNLGDGKSKVLVIDDDPDALRIVTACLAEQGLQTEMAANGREALEVLQRFTPDLIFLDLLMPEMDGITFLDHIRADPRHSHLPVVIITAQQLSASEIQQLSSETRGIIGKAANLKENLQEMLRQILRAEDSDASRLHLTA